MPWIWIIILILATLPALLFKYKFKTEIQGPLVLWRTKKGLKFLKKMSRHKRFWSFLADLGIIFCLGIFGAGYLFHKSKNKRQVFFQYLIFLLAAAFVTLPSFFLGDIIGGFWYSLILFIGGFGFFVLFALAGNTAVIIMDYLAQVPPTPGIAPIIPGVEIPGSPISVPLSAVVGLVVLVIIHEFSHGIVGMVEKIKVKSMGVITLGIFPIGAFTEPDEKQLKKAPMRKRLRTYSVGSMANFVAAFIFLGLFFPFQAAWGPGIEVEYAANAEYYLVNYVESGSPAFNAGIEADMKIYNPEDVIADKIPGKTETLITDKGNITLQRNEKGFLGIGGYLGGLKEGLSLSFQAKNTILEILGWTSTLNFLIAAINFLPFAIFDGARILEDLVDFYSRRWGIKKSKKLAKRVSKGLSVFVLILLLINVMPYFVK